MIFNRRAGTARLVITLGVSLKYSRFAGAHKAGSARPTPNLLRGLPK